MQVFMLVIRIFKVNAKIFQETKNILSKYRYVRKARV